MIDKLYIVIPAYNEEANICEVVRQWYPIVDQIKNESKLLVINDGSQDKTLEKLIELSSEFPLLKYLTKNNSGHGSTVLFGYNAAIQDGAKYIFQTDSDGQTESQEFWKFWEKRDLYDFIIGARKKREDGFDRIIVSKILRIIIFIIFGVNIIDANTPFRLIRSDVLKEICSDIPKNFFLSNVLVSLFAVMKQKKCIWLPVTFHSRKRGKNSINFRKIIFIGSNAIHDFMKLKKSIKKPRHIQTI